MPRLAGHVVLCAASQLLQEGGDASFIEGEAGRQLHEQGPELLAERSGLGKEALQRLVDVRQPAQVRDLLGAP